MRQEHPEMRELLASYSSQDDCIRDMKERHFADARGVLSRLGELDEASRGRLNFSNCAVSGSAPASLSDPLGLAVFSCNSSRLVQTAFRDGVTGCRGLDSQTGAIKDCDATTGFSSMNFENGVMVPPEMQMAIVTE